MSGYDYKKYAVLYVDDELQALKYFPLLFGGDLRCLTASSVAEAKEVIAREAGGVGVVITDQRMPLATGVDLLAWLQVEHPRIVRILTTAYADLASAIEAVNTGAIFRYVVKPWQERDLRGLLLRAMEFHLVQRERDALIREKLSTLQRMVARDRVRSFAVLSASLANRLRNPMLALKAFLDHAPAQPEVDHDDQHLQWAEVWRMAREENQRVLDLVQDVVKQTVEPHWTFQPNQDPAGLLADALAASKESLGELARLAIAPGCPAVAADPMVARRMFSALARRLLATGLAGGALTITASAAQIMGREALRVRFEPGLSAWDSVQLSSLFSALQPGLGGEGREIDLLVAFFIAYHHGGSLTVHRAPPAGPAIEVLLPVDPAASAELPMERDWIETIFSFAEI